MASLTVSFLSSGLVRLPMLIELIANLGGWGIVGFVALYVAVTIVSLPTTVMTLSAGIIYGPIWGVVYAFAGAFCGAVVSFGLGRSVLGNWLLKQLARLPQKQRSQIQAVQQAVGTGGLRLVLLVRLSPLLPFGLLNYGLALTTVRFRDYALGTIGILPTTALYASLAGMAGDLAQVNGAAAGPTGGLQRLLQGVGIAATIGSVLWTTRLARRELARQAVLTEAESEIQSIGE
jgi:uncharacterized membrane protein YdjX (TVP38/TMEM64 family)